MKGIKEGFKERCQRWQRLFLFFPLFRISVLMIQLQMLVATVRPITMTRLENTVDHLFFVRLLFA